ncbi:unnamed protein product [Rangifer tarandus platyrhynchus]|uniref:Uncharacterized protein n=1 Tax=Rangifer tarandus platyrhynchus TaxID=3082113 RepID=A0ABN8XVG3_RANTA|nr:unnamed protein product [Rangifer tarandus platyrhynchus]CAI9151619.1 unnamed protein product [Rangifer tarandus platyrhynchus]CAI9151620.1 unnamed protein product [Rangifer tarandus platyrhynchus]
MSASVVWVIGWFHLWARTAEMGILGGLGKKKLSLVLLNPLFLSGDAWEDCYQEPVSFPASEVPTSQAQLQKSTHVTECLQWQLDQHLDCGESKPILGLSSINWAFTTIPDSGNQGPLFLGKKEKGIRKLWSMCWSSQSCGWRRQRASPKRAVGPVETRDPLPE